MNKVQIVAEIGSNWNPDAPLKSCQAMIAAVAEAGADWAKFQDWHPLEQLDRPDWWKEKCGRWTLEPGWVKELRSYAQKCDTGFITSVFTFPAVLRAKHHPVVKIASSELGNQDLLRAVANATDTPAECWISLGEVGGNEWVNTAIARLSAHQVRLLACVAEYPVGNPLDLWDSFTFAQQWPLPLGVSSHIAYPHCRAMIKQLVQRGAGVVEIHVRMRGVTPDDAPDNGPWALWMDELEALVEMIREVDRPGTHDPANEAWD